MIEWHLNDQILLEWARNDGMTMWWIGYWLGMAEWWWNEMNLKIKGFALVQEYHIISHHSVTPHHFWMTKMLGMKRKWQEWLLNDIFPLWFSFLIILDFLKWLKNVGMRRNGGVLERKIKTEFRDTCHSAIIWSFQSHSKKNVLSHPKLFWDDNGKLHQWNDIRMIEWHSNDGIMLEWWTNIRMSFEWAILAQRDSITLDPPLCQQCAKIEWHRNDGMAGEWWRGV